MLKFKQRKKKKVLNSLGTEMTAVGTDSNAAGTDVKYICTYSNAVLLERYLY